MSGGLFGFTSFMPTTSYKPEEWIKPGQGYNVLKADHETVYAETKDKFQELKQPIKEVNYTQDLKDFTYNDYGRTYHPTYGLNASYYNGLVGKADEKPFGTEVYIPQSYPSHFYNTQKFSPAFIANL